MRGTVHVITTLLILASSMAFSQGYEYAEMQSVVKGFKLEIDFNFGTKYDSAQHYGKFRYVVDGLDFAADRGWELVEVMKFQVMDVYILRRRKR